MKDGKKSIAEKAFYDGFELLKNQGILWFFLKQPLIMSDREPK